MCGGFESRKLEGCRGEVHIPPGWGVAVIEWQEADMSTIVAELVVTPALRTRA